VQESSENLLASAAAPVNNNLPAAAAVSPRSRSRSGLGARFMLLVGGGKKNAAPEDSKENKSSGAGASEKSSTKITKYFHLHRKLCLPLFKPAPAASNINSTSVENVNSVVWIPDKT